MLAFVRDGIHDGVAVHSANKSSAHTQSLSKRFVFSKTCASKSHYTIN